MDYIHACFALQRGNFLLDIDINIPTDGVTALFGPSGSGKTTLLRCLAGLEKTPQGQVSIGSTVWQKSTVFTPTHKRSVGYVFQDHNLFEHLSVTDNLLYGFNRTPKSKQLITFNQVVSLLGLEQWLNTMPGQLSGGQKQRVAIARALLTSPLLLLMDEPLASLDMQGKHEILPYLNNINSELNIPIIYVSHSPDEVLRIADEMILLDKGKVLAQGCVNELLTRDDLPLAHLDEACAILDAAVKSHDPHYHLTYVDVAGSSIAISLQDKPLGSSVRIRILARDVSIALQAQEATSITNIIMATVAKVTPTHDPAKVLITLSIGEKKNQRSLLLAHITAKSADALNITLGQQVYAQVKSVAIMKSSSE
jgi:molybdate transport system ATP-binding protein